MSEARAITNTIGNAVGTMAIASWVGALDRDRMNRVLNGESTEEEIKALYEQEEPAPAPLTVMHKASA
jgi:aerobic C4-dicarboxylate transport protein